MQREKDPTQLPVQLNIKIPWQLREDLYVIAKQREDSLSGTIRQAIMNGLAPELAEIDRKRTAAAGATR